MNGEHLLHADAVGDTTDSDGLLDTAVLLGDDGALEDLDTLARAFLYLHVDTHGVTDGDLGHFVLQGFLVQFLNEIHGYFLLMYRCSCRFSKALRRILSACTTEDHPL